jgi:arginyl-tRNA synthetase
LQTLLDRISEETGKAFAAAGYDAALGRTTVSNRPDLCEFQCNGAMAGAKQYHKAPFVIAEEVAAVLNGSGEKSIFASCEAVKPGFLNFRVSPVFLSEFLNAELRADKYGLEKPAKPERIVLDYGGPNVAKPLHVGHLRSAVIGESIKRIARYCGQDVIGDIHMGDWGLQMGLVITELKKRQPDLPYFDPKHSGGYPEEAPFSVSDLEEIYPFASARSKEDADYYAEAMENTHRLQEGDPGLLALWKQIIKVSVADMKRNYKNLDVTFDLWNGEATVNDIIPGMVEKMKADGYAHESSGALVVDVAEESDAKEIPPCIILKSDGAALYTTTDLATIVDRVQKYDPDEIIYITDKRQELHFTQVFRAARRCGLVKPETKLRHIGFGTVNGPDGRPFKTRQGGVMRLETLISEIDESMLEKIRTNPDIPADRQKETADCVAMAALKYGDLSNQASKDYAFDMDKFMSFEGDTGPYILYTMVRIKSILTKYAAEPGARNISSLFAGQAQSALEKSLMLTLARYGEVMQSVYEELAPHRLCAYIYGLCNDFNSFYHETRILAEQDTAKKEAWIALLSLTLGILNDGIWCLGFSCPERM